MVTVRYRSQAVLVYERLHGSISIFLYHSFCSLHFPIELNGEMLIGQKKSHDYSTTMLTKMHISLVVQATRVLHTDI